MKLIVGVLLSLSLVASQFAVANDALRFIGTWKLGKIESRTESGEWQKMERWGENPFGIIIYDTAGNMAVQIALEDRSGEIIDYPNSEAINGYVAYVATYDVDVDAGTVTHHRLSHTNVKADKLSVVRYYEFSDNTLTLTVAPDKNIRLTWIRQEARL